MKKRFVFIPAMIILLVAFSTTAFSSKSPPSTEIKMPKRVAITSSSQYITVDNKTYELGKDTPAGLPGMYEDVFLIPIKPIADAFHGTYSLNTKTKEIKLVIDHVKFEFKLYSTAAKIDGKSVTLPYEVRLDQGVVKVPAKAFEGKLKNYDVLLFEERALVFREKGKVDFYDELGMKIGFSGIYDLVQLKDMRDRKQAAKIEEIANKIVAKINKPNMSDYEKVMAVNNYLVENIKYDLNSSAPYLFIWKSRM
ncbi:transglutaminase-like putative cysteine protease [Paenibacillus sp. DS2015]|uniref:stalk domain-containing protein n=1 Tax=Paenibacillus sp. DS2015 TaxID=3373917 RepID=UPI003D241B1D